jgi:CheY-like chemotaxis protein
MHGHHAFPCRTAVILLAEDDPGDQELTRRALQHDIIRADLRVVSDGKEALDYLNRVGKYADPETSPRPDLLLLDLNMPRVNGRQVLERMKPDPDLGRIPVVVLTTSNQEQDVLRSYALGCNSFIQKPVEICRFVEVVRQLGHYWFDLVVLPSNAKRHQTPALCT